MSNVKNTWKEIKLLINGKLRADNVILLLRTLEMEEYHIMLIRYWLPNIMNSFYSSCIGPNLAARIPQAQKHFSSFLPKQKYARSFVPPIEIEAEILSIPLHNVYGLYSCLKILKCASKIILSPLCKLINDSTPTGAYLSKFKHASL